MKESTIPVTSPNGHQFEKNFHQQTEWSICNEITYNWLVIWNGSVLMQLAQCRFPGQAISNAKILLYISNKIYEAILSNSTLKLLWFEITKMLIAV